MTRRLSDGGGGQLRADAQQPGGGTARARHAPQRPPAPPAPPALPAPPSGPQRPPARCPSGCGRAATRRGPSEPTAAKGRLETKEKEKGIAFRNEIKMSAHKVILYDKHLFVFLEKSQKCA